MPLPKTPPVASYDPLFDDAWLKWAWAAKHAEALKAEILGMLDSHVVSGLSTRAEYHPEFHGFALVIEKPPRLPDTLGLRLGDVLHGFRSALDSAAWAVVQRGSRPPCTLTDTQKRRVTFPCLEERPEPTRKHTSREHLARMFEEKVPGAGRADLAVIRWVQPYHWPKRVRPLHALPFLIEKNNLDKHKTIQPVFISTLNMVAESINPTDCVVRRVRKTGPGPQQVGAEIARVYVRKTGPNPSIEVHGQITSTVVLNEYLTLEEFLTRTHNWIPEVLSRLSDQPWNLTARVNPEL